MNTSAFILPEGKMICLGRDAANELVIQNVLASRQHALLERRGGSFLLRDRQSTFGTRVNGLKISEQELKNKDLLQIGTQVFMAEISGDRITLIETPGREDLNSAPDVRMDAGLRGREDDPTLFLRNVKSLRTGDALTLESLRREALFSAEGRRLARVDLHEGDLLRAGASRFAVASGTLFHLAGVCGLRLDVVKVSWMVQGRPILSDLTFSVKPGEFVAFLGPSGSGKTSLMRLLAGMDSPGKGMLYADGFLLAKNIALFAPLIGFVPQEDLLRPDFSPSEIFEYIAELRPFHSLATEEKTGRLRQLAQLLDLEAVANRRVNHLSGGEKKRASIGMEMVPQPALLILDEPTSNLDPALEYKTLHLLRRIADKRRTVIASTHRLTQITMFDLVAVLHAGRLVYFGPPHQLAEHFGVKDAQAVYRRLEEKSAPEWAAQFEATPLYDQFVRQRISQKEDFGDNAAHRSIHLILRHASLARQFVLESARYFRSLLRERLHLAILLAQSPLIALLMILVFARGGSSWSLLFCMCLSCIWFGTINSVKEICKERTLWMREHHLGLSIAPYLFSRFFLLAGLCLVQILAMLGIVQLAASLEGRTVFHLMNFFILSLSATAMGLALSAASKTTDRALGVLPVVLIPQILFSGAVVPFDEMFAVSRVISCFTLSRFGFSASKKISLEAGGAGLDWLALFAYTFIFILIAFAVLSPWRKKTSR